MSDTSTLFLDSPIARLDLSTRAQNWLDAEGIVTVGELVRLRPKDLLKIQNIGQVTLCEIEARLHEHGFQLELDSSRRSPLEMLQARLERLMFAVRDLNDLLQERRGSIAKEIAERLPGPEAEA